MLKILKFRKRILENKEHFLNHCFDMQKESSFSFLQMVVSVQIFKTAGA